MSKCAIEGLKELQKKIEKMQKAAKELDGTHTVSMNELFPESFMKKHTEFSSFDDWINSKFKVTSQEDFESIPDEEMDCFVRETTKFSSWKEIHEYVVNDYISAKLGFK